MCYTGSCPYENRWTGECRSGWRHADAPCNFGSMIDSYDQNETAEEEFEYNEFYREPH